jgi:hypothetical protein
VSQLKFGGLISAASPDTPRKQLIVVAALVRNDALKASQPSTLLAPYAILDNIPRMEYKTMA